MKDTMVNSITYQQEFLCMCEQEITPLAEQEWSESGHPTETLVIDWEQYFSLEEAGALLFLTIREGGNLVGYAVILKYAPLTAKGDIIASFDSLYVKPEFRSYKMTCDFFRFIEQCITEDGVHRVVASSSRKKPIDKLLTRFGYSEIERKFEKVI